MPESCSSCVLPIAPAASTVSMRASAKRRSPPRMNSTPLARLPSRRSRATCASVTTVRFFRRAMGWRNAFAAFSRTPRRWLTSNLPAPSLSPRLKSSVAGIPLSTIAARNELRISHCNRCCSTRHSPPAPCASSAPRQWSSLFLNTGSTLSHAQPPSPASRAHSS
jgi:hypothetical protein